MSERKINSPLFRDRPLLVLALGGNALSPPAAVEDDYQLEREIVTRTAGTLNELTAQGYRLLIVHGNGPQVGRLLQQDPGHGNLDIHIAQTQGELGYLLADAMDEPSVCLLTRVTVADPGPPVKPVGPVQAVRPTGPAARSGAGWRVLVPSPRPVQVEEFSAVAALLNTKHVIAGGGGGIPRTAAREPVNGVVDKDWIAALLAIRLSAEHLIFATDVAGVYEDPTMIEGKPVEQLTPAQAHRLIASGDASPGSMGPKLESASNFATETGRTAGICALDKIDSALLGLAGTRIG